MSKINTAEMLYEIYLALGGEPIENAGNINTAAMLGDIKYAIENGGGGGGGSASIVFTLGEDENENFTLSGANPEEVLNALENGASFVISETDEQEGVTVVTQNSVFSVQCSYGVYMGQTMYVISVCWQDEKLHTNTLTELLWDSEKEMWAVNPEPDPDEPST